MEERAPASSAMPQLPEPMSGSGAHIRAQRWLSLLVPVSLSRSVNPTEQRGAGRAARLCFLRGAGGGGGCWEILFYLQVMLSQDLLSRSSVAYWHEPMNCKRELQCFFSTAEPAQWKAEKLKCRRELRQITWSILTTLPLLFSRKPDAIYPYKTSNYATTTSPATRRGCKGIQ